MRVILGIVFMYNLHQNYLILWPSEMCLIVEVMIKQISHGYGDGKLRGSVYGPDNISIAER